MDAADPSAKDEAASITVNGSNMGRAVGDTGAETVHGVDVRACGATKASTAVNKPMSTNSAMVMLLVQVSHRHVHSVMSRFLLSSSSGCLGISFVDDAGNKETGSLTNINLARIRVAGSCVSPRLL